MSIAKTSNTQKTPQSFRRDRIGQKVTPYLFLSPFLVGFLVFMVYPLIYAFNLSLYRKKLVGVEFGGEGTEIAQNQNGRPRCDKTLALRKGDFVSGPRAQCPPHIDINAGRNWFYGSV